MSNPSSGDTSDSPRLYLLLENPRKSNNLGPILRCAAAFGISRVVAVGNDKCATQGSHGAAKHVSIVAFPTVDQAVSYLCGDCDCKSLVGLLGGVANAYDCSGYSVVEANDTFQVATEASSETVATRRSYPIHTRPFVEGNCCFVICKNARGLPSSLARQCDFFVHVPHVSTLEEDSRLLDVPSCLSIALHHFTAWAKYDERGFQGHKYEVGMTQQKTPEEKEATRLARAEARRQQQAEDDIGGNLFDQEEDNDDDY